MATSFRQPFEVIARMQGHWQDGHYYPAQDSAITRQVMMTVQNPGAGDRNAIESLPMGNRVSRYIKIYTDERLTAMSQEPGGAPGDLVKVDNKVFVIIGETNFNMLKQTRQGTPVSHFRYFAAQLIEPDGLEATPH